MFDFPLAFFDAIRLRIEFEMFRSLSRNHHFDDATGRRHFVAARLAAFKRAK
jgi:hypothetical protein